MATLTANNQLLPEHCIHKLPASCRLTAKPICCACQDNRPHASSYQKYIDGVGFVPWGTRQERYCWPCKEFWDARISLSGMRQADTKIPDRPDLTNFLTQWYNWHRGYRIIKHEDGREERQTMVGEPLSDTPHGYLPRSLDELRNGLQHGDRERIERGGRVERVEPTSQTRSEDDFVIPEDERLFDEEPEEPEEQPTRDREEVAGPEHGHLAELAGDMPHAVAIAPNNGQLTQPSGPPSYNVELARPLRIAREHYSRVTSLRRELQRMRVGIERVRSGLQSLEIDVPDSTEALEQINLLHGHLSRYQEAPLDMPEMNNPDWQSPISSMFDRAWRWHNQVQADRMLAISALEAPPLRDAQGHIVARGQAEQVAVPANGEDPGSMRTEDQWLESLRQARIGTFREVTVRREEPEEPFLGLDEPGRPPAIEDDEAFKIDARCEVCLQQMATIATFPCGHMVMCSWCADEVIPRHPVARNVPRDTAAKCPQCRRKVKHIYTVHVRRAQDYSEDNHAVRVAEARGDEKISGQI